MTVMEILEMIRSFTARAVFAAATVSAQSAASTVNFSAYTNNSGDVARIVTTAAFSETASTFTITLSNNSTAGVITEFYFETGDAIQGLGSATIQNGSGTSFSPGARPKDPKGGIHNTVGGAWSGNFFSMGANSPSPHNGVGIGESISIVFNRTAGFSLTDLIDAINAQEIRFAQHYQEWGEGGDDSEWLVSTGFSNNLIVVPLPPAAWAGLGTLAMISGVRAARRRSAR